MAHPSEVVRKLRAQAGLTQEELANRSGLRFSFVRSVEQGRNALSAYDKRQALAKGLGVSLVDFARMLDAR